MVRVYTDHPELLNDLGEVIRLYLPMEEVVPAENGEAAPFISAVMEESGDTWRAVCTADMDGARAEYVYLHPNVGGGVGLEQQGSGVRGEAVAAAGVVAGVFPQCAGALRHIAEVAVDLAQ